MYELGLIANFQRYAEIMAEALALMHWCAGIDANDVEFVLAPPGCSEQKHSKVISNCLGDHVMWILDFDCCRKMTFDKDGVDQAVSAFYRNDPFYPRPKQQLWGLFRQRYLRTSTKIFLQNGLVNNKDIQVLPGAFIREVENRAVNQSQATQS